MVYEGDTKIVNGVASMNVSCSNSMKGREMFSRVA